MGEFSPVGRLFSLDYFLKRLPGLGDEPGI
jgi:hypothetical protein